MAVGGGGPVAQAAVELVADGNKLSGSVRTSLSGAGASAAAEGSKAGNMFGTSFWGRVKNIAEYTGIRDAAQMGFGAVATGIKSVIDTGIDYQNAMSSLGAVTHASSSQMAAAGTLAQQLGRDMSLPGVTATDAADAMLDLAKSGQPLDRAMANVRSTLQLQTAAHLDAARAAQIQGDTMDIWAMSSDQASHAADVLANTITNTSGDINDLYTGLKYIGPVAHSLGIDLDDTATAMAEMGKAGILGSMAGTTLRSMLTSLTHPTAQAQGALKALGVQAFDNQGHFVGLEKVIGQLQSAQGRMTQQQFASNAVMAFGQEALSGVVALSHDGVDGFDKMRDAVTKQGGAAALSAAQNQGLGKTFANLKQVASDVALQIFNAVAPALMSIGGTITKGLSTLGPLIAGVLRPVATVFQVLAQVASAVLAPALGLLAPLFHLLTAAVNSDVFRAFAAALAAGAAAFLVMKLAMDADLLVVRAWEIATKLAAAAQAALNLVMDANPIVLIAVAIAGLVAAFVVLWNKSAAFRDFWIGIWDAVKSAFQAVINFLLGLFRSVASFLGQWGPTILAVLVPFIGIPLLIVQHWGQIVSWFAALPGRIGSFLASLPGILWNAFLTALRFALNAVIQGIEWIIALIIVLPIRIVMGLAQLGVMLWNALVAAWQWAVNATVAGIEWIVGFAISLPGRIVSAVIALGAMLAGWASAAWNWAVGATVAAAQGIFNFVVSIPGRIVGGLAALGGMLANAASSAFSAFVNGAVAAANGIWGFIQSIPGRIMGALGDLGGLLLNAGKAIINGLLNGIKNAIGGVFDFIGGIGDKIASLKGPLPKDKVLLVPAGKAIIGGLDRGLRSEFGTVRSTLRQFTKEIPGLDLKLQASSTHTVRQSGELADAYRAAYAHAAVNRTDRSRHREVHVNAPISLHTQTTSPLVAARLAADEIARAARV